MFESAERSMEIQDLSCQDLGEYLIDQGIHQEVVTIFHDNRIYGESFLEMKEDDLKEMLLVISDRILIRKLLKNLQKVKCMLLC